MSYVRSDRRNGVARVTAQPGASAAVFAVSIVSATTLFVLHVVGFITPQLFVAFCVLSGVSILAAIFSQSISPGGYSWIEAAPWFVGMSVLYLLVRPAIVIGVLGGADDTTVDGAFGITNSFGAVVKATYVGLFGVVAFQFGYLAKWGRRIGASWAAKEVPIPKNQFVVLAAITSLLLLGFAGRVAIVSIKGGIASFQDLRGANNAGLGPVWYLAGLTITGAVIYIWAVCSGWCRRYSAIDLLIVLSSPSILFINSRGGFLYFALAGLVSYRVFKPRARLVGPIAIIAAIVIGWGMVRGQLAPDASYADVALPTLETAEDVEQYTAKFMSLGVTDYYWYVVDNTPGIATFQYGTILGRSIIDMTPRALWPDKPLTAGNYFMQVFFPDLTSTILTPGMFGLLYLDGALPAVIIGCFLYGVLMVSLCSGALGSRGPTLVSLVYALTFPNVPNVMQSGLQTIPTGWVWVAPPVIALILVSRSFGVSSHLRRPVVAPDSLEVKAGWIRPGARDYGRR